MHGGHCFSPQAPEPPPHLRDGAGERRTGLVWAAPGSLFVAEVGRAYAARGPRGLADVTGPWAVGIWDAESSDYVLAADPVGVHPLFWARTPDGGVVAASWLDALARHPDVDDAIDYEGVLLAEGMEFHGPRAATRTPFREISRVPAGHLVRVRGTGTPRLERYWRPEDLPGPDESMTLGDCAELLRERIDAAIARLLPESPPVGAHVSGGLDSTAIACRASQRLTTSGRALAAGYSWAPSHDLHPRGPRDERALLDQVSSDFGFPIRVRDGEGYPPWFAELDPAAYVESTHTFEAWTLPMAAADGVQVILSGWGGDELASYNGTGTIDRLVRRGRLAVAWREAAQRLEVVGSPAGHAATGRALLRALWMQVPPSARRVRHPRRSLVEGRHEAEVLRAVAEYSAEAAEIRQGSLRVLQRPGDHHARQLMLLQRGHLQHRTTWWYQTGQLFGIQYRYPLLDLGVVEAALRLPWWAYRSRGWDRPAFRMAVEPWVPGTVAWNVSKAEPALYNAASVTRHRENGRPRRRPEPDREYDAAMALAWLTWSALDQGPPAPQDPVRDRTDRAIRPA